MVDYMNALGMCANCGEFRGWADGPLHRCAPAPAMSKPASITFSDLRTANATRCRRWHPGGIGEWSVADWAVAMLGEAGEACNAIKKLRRIETGALSLNEPGRQFADRAAAIAAIGEELADTMIYLDLVAQRLGIDVAAEVIRKFNSVSERYGFPERLPLSESAGQEVP